MFSVSVFIVLRHERRRLALLYMCLHMLDDLVERSCWERMRNIVSGRRFRENTERANIVLFRWELPIFSTRLKNIQRYARQT